MGLDPRPFAIVRECLSAQAIAEALALIELMELSIDNGDAPGFDGRNISTSRSITTMSARHQRVAKTLYKNGGGRC
ncbi:MAG: hypothetical protein H6808_08550 [Phycisphaera sp.]|nr:hypothetical protein [Phycisphaera sp.]